MKKLSIIIPTYNEKENVELLYEQLARALEGIDFEVIFVDDSKDETPQVIAKMQAKYQNIVLKHRENEKGLATAVLLGFSLAQGDFLAVMDADLQHPPLIMRSMYAVMQKGYDFCIPSRLIDGGDDGGLNLWRKFVSSTARNIGKLFLKSLRGISDPTSGLFMFRKEIIAEAKLKPIGWKIMIEVLAMTSFHTICEIPYVFGGRNAGESKLDSQVTLEYLKQIWALRKREVAKKIQVVSLSQKEIDQCLEALKKEKPLD